MGTRTGIGQAGRDHARDHGPGRPITDCNRNPPPQPTHPPALIPVRPRHFAVTNARTAF